MTATKTARVRKRCTKCGHVTKVPPRQRHCHHPAFGKGSYRCHGPLNAIARAEKGATVREAVMQMVEDGQSAAVVARVMPPKITPRRDYERKLAKAHNELLAAVTRLKRVTTSVALWQRRIKHYERQIEARDHPKPPRPKREKKTRAIEVTE